MRCKFFSLSLGVIGVGTALLLAGCQTASLSSSANTTNANTIENSHQSQDIVEDVFADQQKVFQNIYDNAKTSFIPEEKIKGVVLGATINQKKTIATFFKSLENNQNFKTFVIIEPLTFAQPLSSAQKKTPSAGKILLVSHDVQTPFGLIAGDDELAEKLLQQGIKSELQQKIMRLYQPLPGKNYRYLLLPFIKKSFENARYVEIFVDEKISSQEQQALAETIQKSVDDDTLVIAHTAFNASNDPGINAYQLQFTKNIVENFDTTKIDELPFSQTITTKVLLAYLSGVKAQTGRSFVEKNEIQPTEKPALAEYFTEGPLVLHRNIFLVSFGDIMLGRQVRDRMNSNSLDYPFEKMDPRYLQSNDILMANLEGPIATKPVATNKGIAFRFFPDVAPLLKKHFFDAVSGANNHALDMGIDGYKETRQFIQQQGMMIFGNPKEVNDESVATTMIQGQKIAFIGFDDVDFKLDDETAVAKVKELVSQGYKVIPFFHWGVEYNHIANDRQRALAHSMIEAGAIAVIGCHPHVVQTYETYKGHPIFYSLGNAIFDQEFSTDTQEGLSIALNIANDQMQISLFPIRILKSQMQLMTPAQRQKFLETFVAYGSDYSGEEKQQILNGQITLSLQTAS